MEVYRRSTKPLVIVLFSLCIYFQDVSADCTPSKVKNYTVISEDHYDMNFTTIGTEGKRPYGFDQALWEYNAPASENPCVHISGTSGRRVEVLVETEPPNRLCMKTATSPDICFDGRAFRCLKAEGDDFYLEFFCDAGCSELDVPFWYRLVIGDPPMDDPEDHWCEFRSRDQYPSNLQQLPPNFDIPTTTTKNPGDAACVATPSFLLSWICMAFALRLLSLP